MITDEKKVIEILKQAEERFEDVDQFFYFGIDIFPTIKKKLELPLDDWEKEHLDEGGDAF